MMDGGERARVGSAASKHVESTAIAHDTARTAVTFKDRAQGTQGKSKSKDVIAGGAAVCDVSNRGVEGQ